MTVDPNKYVVLDVETNGLSSERDDLLSVSFYRPDTQLMYNRFLPLELNTNVKTTSVNGITEEIIKNCKALSQDEVDQIIINFELKERTILTYGNLDRHFIKGYFKRHRLKGFDSLLFYNFKHDIISSSFSEGNITKDNLCRLFEIPHVTEIHSGQNDCYLEWQLFQKLDGRKLLITDNKVFFINDDYYIPASFLKDYPNFKYYATDLPTVKMNATNIKTFSISDEGIKKFPTNFNGVVIEHLINSMLKAKKEDAVEFLLRNKSKCQYIGNLPSITETVYLNFDPNGMVSAVDEKNKELGEELNRFLEIIKNQITPIVGFIKDEIFCGEQIHSQELVVHDDYKVLAVCDLSSSGAVLEIKTSYNDLEEYKEQLFYEAKGRNCYLLQTGWVFSPKRQLDINIYKIEFSPVVRKPGGLSQELRKMYFQERIRNKKLMIVAYESRSSPITVRCTDCGYQWEASSYYLLNDSRCPNCDESKQKEREKKEAKKARKTKEEILLEKEVVYNQKLLKRSNNSIYAYGFQGSNQPINAICLICNNKWISRADHLLERPYCIKCKMLLKQPHSNKKN